MWLTAVGWDIQEGTGKKEKPILWSKNFTRRFNKEVKKVVESGVASIDFLLKFPGWWTKNIIDHLKEKGFIEEWKYLFLKDVDYYDYYENYKSYIDKLTDILNSKVDGLWDKVFFYTEHTIVQDTLFKVLENNVQISGNSIDYLNSDFEDFDKFILFYSEKNNISNEKALSDFSDLISDTLSNINYRQNKKLHPYNQELLMDWWNGGFDVFFDGAQYKLELDY